MSENLENPIPNSSSVERDVTGTLQEHWRKGIPTLVLLLLATFVSCYYYLLVKPGLQARYSAIIQSNLKRIGMVAIDANTDSGTTTTELSPRERIEILRETQLSLRRLVGWNPKDDSIHYRYGIVSHELSLSYLREALSSGDVANSQFLGLAKNEQQNAMSAMEKVRKLNTVLAPKASLWLTQETIANNFAMSNSDLLSIEKTIRPLLENESIASSAKLTLAPLLVERAFRHSSELDLTQRLALLAEADQLLRTDSPNDDLNSLGLLAEAVAIVDAAKAQEYANNALQRFWSTREAETQTTESLAAVFRCLLLVNSFKEAQVILSEQLQKLSSIEQPKFRVLTAAAALRHCMLIAIRVGTNPTAAANSSKDAEAVLSLAIQLAPESTELISLLQSISKPEDSDPIISWLKEELTMKGSAANSPRLGSNVSETGIGPFFKAVIGLGRGDLSESTTSALSAATKLSSAYGVAASRLVVQMELADSVPAEVAIGWLRTINTSSPDVLAAWSDRASLHLKYKQPAEAIECLEFLVEKLPGNLQIVEALDGAKRQLKNDELPIPER